MRTQSTAEENQSSAITPPVRPRMPWRVVTVAALPDYRLRVRFVDGTEGTVDLKGLIHSPRAGVFAALADPSLFARVYVEHGAVAWPGEIDLAPDAMHAEIRKAGQWVLR